MTVLSPELEAWARECLGAGDDPAEVAAECGCDAAHLLLGLGLRPLGDKAREAVSLYVSGATFAEVSRALGYPQGDGCSAARRLVMRAARAGYAVPIRPEVVSPRRERSKRYYARLKAGLIGAQARAAEQGRAAA